MTDQAPMPAAIVAAIIAIMNDVPKLEKSEQNTHGRYNFASIDDFLEAVRPLCAKHGLVIMQDEADYTSDGNWLTMRFAFTLAYSGGEKSVTWEHRPVRTALVNAKMGSQALGAAQSYALKMFMRSLFQISTGEKGQDIGELPASKLPTATNPKPAPESTLKPWSDYDLTKTGAEQQWREVMRAIKAADTEVEIDGLLADNQLLVEAIMVCTEDKWGDCEKGIQRARDELRTRVDVPV